MMPVPEEIGAANDEDVEKQQGAGQNDVETDAEYQVGRQKGCRQHAEQQEALVEQARQASSDSRHNDGSQWGTGYWVLAASAGGAEGGAG